MTDFKLLVLHRNAWNLSSVLKQMEFFKSFNHDKATEIWLVENL